MQLTNEEQEMLDGKQGNAVKKSMEILVALGEIYDAEKLVSISSVQIAGVSYSNLGDAGLEYLAELAKDGKVKVVYLKSRLMHENDPNYKIQKQFDDRVLEVCDFNFNGEGPRFDEFAATLFKNKIIPPSYKK